MKNNNRNYYNGYTEGEFWKLVALGVELWSPVVGYEGLYEVSTRGRIRSLDRYTKNSAGVLRRLKGKMLSPRKQKASNSNTYLTILLTKDGVIKSHLIHRLVMEAFIPATEGKEQVNHINGLKFCNEVWNLEWVNPSENQIHAIKEGLKVNPCGERSAKAKLTEIEVLAIKLLLEDGTYSLTDIGRTFGVTSNAISSIKRGLTWNEADPYKVEDLGRWVEVMYKAKDLEKLLAK